MSAPAGCGPFAVAAEPGRPRPPRDDRRAEGGRRRPGVVGERARKFKAMTDSDHTSLSAPNLLDRDCTPDRRNQEWAADRPGRQQPHEARSGDPGAEASRDIASQCPVGQWMTIALRSPSRGGIVHSARGGRYCSHDDQKVLRAHGLKASPLVHADMPRRAVDEQQGHLLWQRCRRDRLQDDQGRDGHLLLHQRLP